MYIQCTFNCTVFFIPGIKLMFNQGIIKFLREYIRNDEAFNNDIFLPKMDGKLLNTLKTLCLQASILGVHKDILANTQKLRSKKYFDLYGLDKEKTF